MADILELFSSMPGLAWRGTIRKPWRMAKLLEKPWMALKFAIFAILASAATYGQEHDHAQMLRGQAGHDHARPDSHAPISVMVEHSPKANGIPVAVLVKQRIGFKP